MQQYPLESEAVLDSAILVWLLSSSRIPAAIVGLNRDVLYASGTCLKLLGVQSAAEIDAANVHDFETNGVRSMRFAGVANFRQESVGISWKGLPAKLIVFVSSTTEANEESDNEEGISKVKMRSPNETKFDSPNHRDFLAVLSHELRNPVAALAGGFDLMKAEDFSPATCENLSPLISDQLDHIRRLLDDLLDVARVQHGKLTISVAPIDIRKVVENCVAANKYAFIQRSQRVELVMPDDPVMVSADITRLDQVVANLLDNASRFSPRDTSVWIKVSFDSQQATISVRDEGIGIEEEFHNKIFHPFAQASRCTSSPLSGLGVGLSISRELMRLHGGDIIFHSDGCDKGSEFFVMLPVSKDIAPPAATLPRTTVMQKILVVEDSIAIQTVLKRLLVRLGHDVTTVSSGEDAVEMLGNEQFDAALVDIQLPGISGYDVANWVRNSWKIEKRTAAKEVSTTPYESNAPTRLAQPVNIDWQRPALIAVTGFAQPEDKAQAIKAGFDAHLAKPVNLGVLAETLQQYSQKE